MKKTQRILNGLINNEKSLLSKSQLMSLLIFNFNSDLSSFKSQKAGLLYNNSDDKANINMNARESSSLLVLTLYKTQRTQHAQRWENTPRTSV